MKHEQADVIWEKGWDGHQRSQMLRLARLSLADKIQWLEDAQEVVAHLSQASRTTVAATRQTTRTRSSNRDDQIAPSDQGLDSTPPDTD